MKAIVIAPAQLCHQGRIVEIEPSGLVEGDLDDGSDAYEGYHTTPILDTSDEPGVPWIYGIECFSILPPESEVDTHDQVGLEEAKSVINFIKEYV